MKSGYGALLFLDIVCSIAAALGSVFVEPLVLSVSGVAAMAVMIDANYHRLLERFFQLSDDAVPLDESTRVPFDLYMKFGCAGDRVSGESGQFYVAEIRLPDGTIKKSLCNRCSR
eukprot:NODE_19370_length_846_cov_3.856745.p1 GENE.NODE_19370_length_846_cov_3.856745~~NODE_19370_length_846_cov_3.856745.p1  ORF type:complete len:115 (+),score=19.29 NODE_19370_length_846_cov_3.856745:81-425(+)